MEKNNQSNNANNEPEVSEETFDEKKEKEERTPPLQIDWKEVFVKISQKFFTVCKNLWRKARSIQTTMFKDEGDVSPLDDIKGAFKHIPLRKRGLGYVLLGLILSVYLLSGVYTVKPGEEAVARIFGKEVRHTISEGLHYRLPWPFEAIEKVSVMEIRRVDVGIPLSEAPLLFPKKASSAPSSPVGEHSGHEGHGVQPMADSRPANVVPGLGRNQFLTGDENILEIKMNIQYRIKDASDYLFNVNSPDSLVPYTARTAVTDMFGRMEVDELLTVAKSQIQKRIASTMQHMLDEYGAGLDIVNVSLQEVNPPEEVAQAFRDVASAREEREETINKAQGYWNTVIPEARGKAHTLISNAEGYKEEVINRASGDAEKFLAMLREYQKAENVTEYRLYLETMEKVLARTQKFVVDSKEERVNLKFVK